MRNTIFSNLNSERDYTASTGLTKSEFEELSISFCELYKVSQNTFPENFGNVPAFEDGKELLFLLLYYKKVYPTFDVLALCFDISRKTAHAYIQQAKAILKSVLDQKSLLPKRFFKDETEFTDFFKEVSDLMIDATERPIQRPVNVQVQQESYSVKKTMFP
jgi:hypothetical protein